MKRKEENREGAKWEGLRKPAGKRCSSGFDVYRKSELHQVVVQEKETEIVFLATDTADAAGWVVSITLQGKHQR